MPITEQRDERRKEDEKVLAHLSYYWNNPMSGGFDAKKLSAYANLRLAMALDATREKNDA